MLLFNSIQKWHFPSLKWYTDVDFHCFATALKVW